MRRRGAVAAATACPSSHWPPTTRAGPRASKPGAAALQWSCCCCCCPCQPIYVCMYGLCGMLLGRYLSVMRGARGVTMHPTSFPRQVRQSAIPNPQTPTKPTTHAPTRSSKSAVLPVKLATLTRRARASFSVKCGSRRWLGVEVEVAWVGLLRVWGGGPSSAVYFWVCVCVYELPKINQVFTPPLQPPSHVTHPAPPPAQSPEPGARPRPTPPAYP